MSTLDHLAVSQLAIVARHDRSGTFDINTLQKETQGGRHGSAN
jgi:hypothetical protein